MDAVAVPTAPPPDTKISSVPKSPDVLMEVEPPASNWKEFEAIGVPFKLMGQDPGLSISPPRSVMVKTPTALAAQFADTEKTGGAIWANTGCWPGSLTAITKARMNPIVKRTISFVRLFIENFFDLCSFMCKALLNSMTLAHF
jgi:hypothetical protein